MTPGGKMMLRIKKLIVFDAVTASWWRLDRAEGLARFIGRYRATPRRYAEGRAYLKRIITEDIVADCGWPRLSWLKPRVRAEQERIEAFRREYGFADQTTSQD
jgi:hypothetical protein